MKIGPLGFFSFGFGEMLVVGTVALLVFGGELPQVMRRVGRAYARLRRSLDDATRPLRDEMRRLDHTARHPPATRRDDTGAAPRYPATPPKPPAEPSLFGDDAIGPPASRVPPPTPPAETAGPPPEEEVREEPGADGDRRAPETGSGDPS